MKNCYCVAIKTPLYFLKNPKGLLGLFAAISLTVNCSIAQTLSGELRQWHKITLTFTGPSVSESDPINPFTDFRLDVNFSQGTLNYTVPGYYAADGNAAHTSAASGNKWRVHFCPPTTGLWNYQVSFRTGAGVAMSYTPNNFATASPHGLNGNFTINASDKTGDDFRAKGWLEHQNEFFYRFKGNGEYYLKNGCGSPENFLAYYEFDNTIDHPGGLDHDLPDGLHHYETHLSDWTNNDPTWKNGLGKRLIGAINYLASQKVNALYMILMNVEGDGREVFPWTAYNERARFDVSKLDQWELVFSHMQSKGIALHLVFQEMENCGLLGTTLTSYKRLYYREMIARFAHHNALFWNIGEEYTRSGLQAKGEAEFVKSLDPYKHICKVHTHNRIGEDDDLYDPILGATAFDGTSLQQSGNIAHSLSVKWREKTENSGWRWAVELDEIEGGINCEDIYYSNYMRKKALWGNLMGGGAGIDWYLGYQRGRTTDDIDNEDFRKQQLLWTSGKYAIDFFKTQLPFAQMEPSDFMLNSSAPGDQWVLAKPGDTYAVYFSSGGAATLSLPGGSTWTLRWYNPRTGSLGASQATTGILNAPSTDNDWVALIKKASSSLNQAPVTYITSPIQNQVFGIVPASILIKTQTSDADGFITKVEFYQGAIKLGEKNSAPFQWTWNNVSAGTYVLTTRAYDNSGNQASSAPVTITVDPNAAFCSTHFSLINPNTDQSISGFDTLRPNDVISTPLTGTALNVQATTHAASPGSVRFELDGALIATDNSYPYALGPETTGDFGLWAYAYGMHTLKATIYSGINATGTALCSHTCTFEITASNTNKAPTASILAPTANSTFPTGTPIPVQAQAYDQDGKITRVDFFRNGVKIGKDLYAPYEIIQQNLGHGTYTLTAKAYDNFGAETISEPVQFKIDSTFYLDIMGPDCAEENGTNSYTLHSRFRNLATGYNWWYAGSSQSLTTLPASPYQTEIFFGPYPSLGQVCVNVNYSQSPWNKTYCKNITLCEFPGDALSLSEEAPNRLEQEQDLPLRILYYDLSGRQIVGWNEGLPSGMLAPGCYIKTSVFPDRLQTQKIFINP